MERPRRDYTVWGTVVEERVDRFVVVILAQALDLHGPEEILKETTFATNREAAKLKMWEMMRGTCARLKAQGNRVIDVASDL